MHSPFASPAISNMKPTNPVILTIPRCPLWLPLGPPPPRANWRKTGRPGKARAKLPGPRPARRPNSTRSPAYSEDFKEVQGSSREFKLNFFRRPGSNSPLPMGHCRFPRRSPTKAGADQDAPPNRIPRPHAMRITNCSPHRPLRSGACSTKLD